MKTYKEFINEKVTICPYCLGIYNESNKISILNENLDSYDSIRSISIVIPTNNTCVNKCRFCVSRMHKEDYDDLTMNPGFEEMYYEKLKLCKDKGAKFAILTGVGEPLQNKRFLRMIGKLNQELGFILEIQTSGVMLSDENLKFLKDEVGLETVSLSVSDLMDDASNADYIRMLPKLQFNLKSVCHRIKQNGFTLRISLNLVDSYDKYSIDEIFERLKDIKADQAIFRILWRSGTGDEIDSWIGGHSVSQDWVKELVKYVKTEGKLVGHLPDRYMIKGVSTVVDSDCMNTTPQESQFRYLILRSDCNLYTHWDKKNMYE